MALNAPQEEEEVMEMSHIGRVDDDVVMFQ